MNKRVAEPWSELGSLVAIFGTHDLKLGRASNCEKAEDRGK